MNYLLGVDNGGTFVKAGVIDGEGRLLAVSREPIHNQTPRAGYTERDMEELWLQNAKVIRQAVEKSGISPTDIAGVSFSGHGKGLYLVDREGKPARPGILSTDTRAWEQVKRWKEDGTAEKIYPRTMQDILACQPVSLLAWLKEHEPTVLARTAWVFSVKDYIRFRLTGKANGEYTDFSGGNLVNLTTGAYDRELMALFGLEEVFDKLPPLVYSHEVCGAVTSEAAALTGLKAGTPVMAGMFDVDACGIASGLGDEEGMCMIAGTWSINEYITRAPITNRTVALNSMFCLPGYYLIEESSPTSAGNLQWFIDKLLAETGEKLKGEGRSVYDLLNAEVAAIAPEDQDVYFLPFLNGSNESALAKGCFVGLTDYHTRAHIVRAVYEGIVFSHLTHVKRLLANREPPKTVRLAGGAANSPVWVQMFADALQLPIETVECGEQGILGAAIAAGVGAGVFESYQQAMDKMVRVSGRVEPRKEYRAVYEKKYRTYRAIVEALDPVWEQL